MATANAGDGVGVGVGFDLRPSSFTSFFGRGCRGDRKRVPLSILVILLCGRSLLQSRQIAGTTASRPQSFFWEGAVEQDNSSGGGRESIRKHKRNNNDDEFAACLIFMDDSHHLIEWLAYHYHAVNLRTLIIAVDPNSRTSPKFVLDRWRDYMDIIEWKDNDYYATPKELQEATVQVMGEHNNYSPSYAQLRARQRLFYYKCLQTLKDQGQHWTLLTETDEFITLNYQLARAYNMTDPEVVQPPSLPGSVARLVLEYATRNSSSSLSSSAEIQQPIALFNLQSSPCVQIPRIRFGARESNASDIQQHVPSGYDGRNFLTLRWRSHAWPKLSAKKVSKAILDLSRIDVDEIVPLNRMQRPVPSLCPESRLHLRKSESLLVINHYLGSLKHFLYRENYNWMDGQLRSHNQFQKLSTLASKQPDDDGGLRPWLHGFHQNPPIPRNSRIIYQHLANRSTPQQLLDGVGNLQPKSWTTYEGDPNKERCAFCFFGLPRAFQSLVLPSIVKNLLIPNARHNCDVYVHFFEQYEEPAGRKNRGGAVDPRQIYLLEEAVKEVQARHGEPPGARTHRTPTIVFAKDTDADFWKNRGPIIAKFQNTTKPEDGRPMYFPYKDRSWSKSTLDNVVHQWHSIQNAFEIMESTGHQMGFQYSRVGMFRSDALYMTPIDIAMLDNGVADSRNRHVVVPGFAQYPVNDRMIYGNIDGVKIWATHRFSLIEERAKSQHDQGYVMHSERFMKASVFRAIEASGCVVNTNMDICFARTRADESAMISDCTQSGHTRGWIRVDGKALVESIVQKNCTRFKNNEYDIFAGCGEGINYTRKK